MAPGQVVIAAGDSQSASLGTALATPLKVKVIGTNNRPFPGAAVTWTVTQGVAVAQPPVSVSDAAGEATTTLVLGLETGPVRITASVGGVVPVVLSATATVVYSFPCQIQPFAFGSIVTGAIDAGDCNINGYYLDVLGFTLPSQQSLSISMVTSASTMDPWVGLYRADGNFQAMNDDSSLAVVHSSMLNAIVAGGGYLITPGTFGAGQTGDYTLIAYGRPAVLVGCDTPIPNLGFMDPGRHLVAVDRSAVWVTRGVSFSETVTTGDCVDASGPFYSDRVVIYLDSGSVLKVREASTDFDAYLTLFGPNNFRAENDDSSGTTTNAYLVAEAPVSAVYFLDFGTRDTATTGNYMVSIPAASGLTAQATQLGAPAHALVAHPQPRLHDTSPPPSQPMAR